MKQLFLNLILLFLFVGNIDAQFYNTGQDRASIKWKQINTEKFRLVFPDFAEKKAQHFANKLFWASQNVGKDLDTTTSKIDIIMHMESSTSNAMVVWAPKRMEVHSLNSQTNYAQEWFEQLALHEYRHVVQVDKLNEGFTKIISLVFGEMGTSVVLGAYLPLWYLEGDAVAAETALSSTGRGRKANFDMPLRAQLTDIGKYSYDKATMGSYRNFVPNHYILGYHLVTLGKNNYGDSIWKNAESFIARYPYYIVPFSHSIRKHSGLRKKAFYDTIMQELKTDWSRITSDFNPKILVANNTKFFTSYTNAHYINDSTIFARKTGINEIGSFVLLVYNGEQYEERLLLPGYGSFNNISYHNDKLFWVEKRYHNRWQHLSYSVLMSYDFKTQKREQLSRKTRYYFPSYNSKKMMIACVEQSVEGDYFLTFLKADNAEQISKIAMEAFIKNPYLDEAGENVYYYILRENGFELMEYNIESYSHKSILPASFNNRNRILKHNNSIYYVDDESGVSNVYAHELSTKAINRITDVEFGVGAISLYKDAIIYDNYTSKGWQTAALNIENCKSYNKTIFEHNYFESYISDSTLNIQLNPPKDSVFELNKYSKFTHLLKPHSWGPISVNVDNTDINPGLTVMSQNLLSTMELSGGYEYVLAEQVNKYYAKLKYSALPVIISFNTIYQNRRKYVEPADQPLYGESYTWNETSVGLSLIRGFRFNKNAYNYYIQPNAGLYWLKQGRNNDTPTLFDPKSFVSLSYGLYLSQLRRTAYRDLQTRWGQTYRFSYLHTPFSGLNMGKIFAMEANYYTPFIFPHSGIKTYLAYQDVNSSGYSYSNIIHLPRGYVAKGTFDALSAQMTIAMPLFYPDLSITSLAYFKRVKAYVFADYLYTDGRYTSFGADLRFDVHILRTIAPLDLGIRTAYVSDLDIGSHDLVFQFLFSVSL